MNSTFNWKLAGEVYGVFSKVCFMLDSGRYPADEKVIRAYEIASRDFETGEVNEGLLQILLDYIADNTNSNYWIDFDEELFNDEECDKCDCDECSHDNEVDISDEDIKNWIKIVGAAAGIKDEEIKHWATVIGAALDKAANTDSSKPTSIKIILGKE